MDDLRQVLRELLREELGRVRADLAPAAAPQVTQEAVAIRSSADLNAFALRVLEMAQDGARRADILAGRHRFRLAEDGAPVRIEAHQPAAPPPQAAPRQVRFERGMISERDIAGLPDGTTSVLADKSVRLTPLARDELRRRGIRLERTAS
ncbi:hypothetical protein H1W37_01540 [Stappia taiwanensis]|uniref:Uncharacterized protein n=1 Tax=Stappia taiwanensis TaxID=992267 RepID=A0A838XFY2_9HYPH|nr:hypothetical protein [Stappia taiwanensis]MBA4610319.1 hypothetical protein [Stappia taiwanensis]GGE78623.1 hypothetical protein GCM10007285_03070 [Stappia taiwanensis]